MIMNPKGRAKEFRRWAEGLRSLGYFASARYWQAVVEELEGKGINDGIQHSGGGGIGGGDNKLLSPGARASGVATDSD